MKSSYRFIILFSIALLSLTMHYKHFSKEVISVHVWRQTQTQSTIINFYEGDMNIFEPQRNDRGKSNGVFRMEFPLMQWLIAAIYKIFGNHLIITRIAMFIIGLFSIAGIYKLILFILQNHIIALIGAWTFNFSPCFYYYTINPLPDNFALCCSIWGLVFFFNWYRNDKIYLLIFSGLLLSTGALCKLPFILYFTFPFGYFLLELLKNRNRKKVSLKILAVSIFVPLPLVWYFSVVPGWQGNGIVLGILDNNVSFTTILGYLKYNLFSTLPELLLNYGSLMFFIIGFYFILKNRSFKHPMFSIFFAYSLILLAYFIFEINMIAKVHDYYLFPFFPILFIIVSYGAYNMLSQRNKYIKYLVILLLFILPLTAYLRMLGRWNTDSPGFNKDLLIYKNELRNAVPKNALCIVGNDISHYIFFYYIDKKGWGFQDDNLNAQSAKNMIAGGATYLYSDSRAIDENPDITKVLDKLILERGSIRVYSLKE